VEIVKLVKVLFQNDSIIHVLLFDICRSTSWNTENQNRSLGNKSFWKQSSIIMS